MKTLCTFGEDLHCPACGYKARRTDHRRVCRPPVAVGDAVAAGLAALGITPQLVERVTGRKGCGCKQRQRRLNEAGFAVQRAIREIVAGE
jgi:hypothetical protein